MCCVLPNKSSNEACLTYKIVYVLNFLVCVLVMKLISWWLTSKRFQIDRMPLKDFLIKTPFVSLRSFENTYAQSKSLLLIKLLLSIVLSALCLSLAQLFLVPLNYFETLLIAPVIYFLIEVLGALAQTLFIWSPLPTHPIHQNPLLSQSLGQFWGRDWNGWVQDWLRDVGQGLRGRDRLYKIIMTFIVSGLFHEIMCNLPYWLIYRQSYFGTMMLYFILQAFGLLIEKKFLKHASPHARRFWLWFVVIGPSPLFINVPLLHFLGLI